MTARECAIADIKEDLKQQSKSFISFGTELTKVMNQLVREHIKQQKKKTSYCLSSYSWSKKA